jgi:hypothetical protein
MKNFMRKPTPSGPGEQSMRRQEAAVWLGRAMSTNEVTLRVTLQLLDVITFQQRAIQALYEKSSPVSGNGQPTGVLLELEQDASKGILAKLTEVRDQLTPVLKVVDDACRQLEKMI